MHCAIFRSWDLTSKCSIFVVGIGVSVGAGLQGTVAIINLCCYYLVGIPIGALLGYVGHLEVEVKLE